MRVFGRSLEVEPQVKKGDGMSNNASESLTIARMIDSRCDAFQQALTSGHVPEIEQFLTDIPVSYRLVLVRELLGLEFDYRVECGDLPVVSDYSKRFPELSLQQLDTILLDAINRASKSTASFTAGGEPITFRRMVNDHNWVGHQLHIYRFVSFVGSGAMGHVYLAKHDPLQRNCAIKILAPKGGTLGDAYVAQFLQEGQAAAALIHPNIVALHAIGCIADTHYLEMEYVPGRSLQKLIRDESPLPISRAMRLITMVADGLAAAHRAGIIHRDVKPDNVLVTPDDIAKIGDFGLAQRFKSDSHDRNPSICGTPNYMAPELFQGQAASFSSDVYALGICLFQLLTGKLPWHETSLAKLMQFGRTETIPNVRDLRPEVSGPVAECVSVLTASSLERRPPNAAAASKLLHAVMGSERDIESLLLEAFRNDTSVTWQRRGELYTVTRQLPNGRQQFIFIETSEHATLERIVLIYSTCCPADSNYYEQALRQNWIVMHGSLAIRDIDGQPMFVVINAYPRSTVAPEEIRRSVIDISQQADEVERHLTGMDRY